MKFFSLIIILLLLVSCGNNPITHEGKEYNCYGFMDKEEEKKPNIIYEISTSNAIGAFIFSETLIIPIWTLGWNIYCPIKVRE